MQSDRSPDIALSLPLKSFLQNSSVIFYQCSLEDQFPIVDISENVEDITGYKAEDFYQDKTFWMKHVHRDDRRRVNEAFLDIINQEKCTLIYRFKHKDGHELWLRDENVVNFDDQGEPEAITGIAVNITAQKKAEQEVRELNQTLEQRIEKRTQNLMDTNRKLKKQVQSRNKAEKQLSEQQQQLRLLQASINHINDVVVISKAPVDDPLNSKIVFTNHAFERFTGYTSAEVKGRKPTFLHGKKTDSAKIRKINRHIKNHQPSREEFINYRKDGSTYWVELEMTPFPAEDGMEYWVGINRDISHRKKTELVLEESEERYRTYTDLSFDAIFELSMGGAIIDCNPRACQLFGYTRGELLKMNTIDLIPEQYKKDRPEQMTPELTTGSEVFQREYRKKDGSTFISEVNTKIYHRSEGDHIIAYVRDISEHIEYEKKIESSLDEKSTLLAEVHHRVKNNLAVISGLLEMQAFNALDKHVVSELKESQSRIQSIATVHEMLYQSESFSNIDLAPYIHELASYISGMLGSENKDITIQKDIQPISLTVKQAVPCGLLLNELLTNAYKHAFAGRDEGVISISLWQEDDMVFVSVADDGLGLPKDLKVEESSSLGMTLMHTLVRQLEGEMRVERKPDTCFKIKFRIQA